MSGRKLTLPEIVGGLRRWTRTHDEHVRVAVELLIGHDRWLRRPEFRTASVHPDREGEVWIDWQVAREAFDAGVLDRSSTTGRAVLDLAIALGANRYRLSAMGPENSRLIAVAVARAVRA